MQTVDLRDAPLRHLGHTTYDSLLVLNQILPTVLAFDGAIPFKPTFTSAVSPEIDDAQPSQFSDSSLFGFRADPSIGTVLVAFEAKLGFMYVFQKISGNSEIKFIGSMADYKSRSGLFNSYETLSFNERNFVEIVYELVLLNARTILIDALRSGEVQARGRTADDIVVNIPLDTFHTNHARECSNRTNIDWLNNIISSQKGDWSEVKIAIRKADFKEHLYFMRLSEINAFSELVNLMNESPQMPESKMSVLSKLERTYPALTRNRIKNIWRAAARAHLACHQHSRWTKPGSR